MTNWILKRISPGKKNSCDPSFALITLNLGNGRVSIKCNKSVLVEQNSSSLYSNLILSLFKVYELNNLLIYEKNNFTLKKYLIVQPN